MTAAVTRILTACSKQASIWHAVMLKPPIHVPEAFLPPKGCSSSQSVLILASFKRQMKAAATAYGNLLEGKLNLILS
jgi:hypothetical protein